MNMRRATIDSVLGLEIDPATRAIILIDERLRAMEAKSDERSAAVARIETTVNQVVTDMAVMKSQHASFWKITTIFLSGMTLLAGVVGWVINHFSH